MSAASPLPIAGEHSRPVEGRRWVPRDSSAHVLHGIDVVRIGQELESASDSPGTRSPGRRDQRQARDPLGGEERDGFEPP